MGVSIGERLFADIRTVGFDDLPAVLVEVDSAIASATDDHDLALLHLTRAIAMQGAGDCAPSAASALTALELLRSTPDVERRCLAAGMAAVLLDQSGQHAVAIEVALEALTLFDDLEVETSTTARSRYAIAGFFFRYASFDLAVELGQSSLDAMSMLGVTDHGLMVYSIGYLGAEAAHLAHDDDEKAERCALATRAADWLTVHGQDPMMREMLVSGLHAEVDLVNGGDCGDIRLHESSAHYSHAAPDLVAWNQLVRGLAFARCGDHHGALEQFDAAIPGLEASKDNHCLVRAYSKRAEVRAEIGDLQGAYDDAVRRGDLSRSWQIEHVALFSDQLRSRVALQRHSQRLEADIERDVLTGVNSRHWLHQQLTDHSDPDACESLAMLDVDNFKAVNDNHGHSVGDEVLVRFAEIVTLAAGSRSDVSRFGGEEFVVLIHDPSPRHAHELCEKIRRDVADHDWSSIVDDLELTVSVGVATGPRRHFDDLLRTADQLLLTAKRSGKNRVESAPQYAI